MEVLGRAPGGELIVKMTSKEAVEFERLRRAIEEECSYVRHSSAFEDLNVNYDFAGVFGAVRAFASARFRATELRVMVDQFETFLTPPTDVTDHITDGTAS